MKIQEYTLCENGETKVGFNEPTVRDCFQFSDLNPKLEQKAVTDYLNHMMAEGQEQDARNWTVFDRQTALVWIYVLSRDDKTVLQKYDCQHCNEEHSTPLNLADLFSNLTLAERSMREPFEIENLKGVIVPLRGYAMEHLEQLQNQRDSHPVNSKAYKLCDADVYLYRIAHSIELEDDDLTLSYDKRADERVERFLELSLSSKSFQRLTAKIRQVASEMRHGLPCVIRDGQVLLTAEEHECPNKEGVKTRLMLPFQVIDYMPSL